MLQGFVTKGEKAMKGVDTAAAFVCISALFSVAALVCMADDLPADVPYMSVALVIDAPRELPAGGGDFVVTVRVEDSLRLAGFQIQLEFYRDDPETRLATAVVVPVKKSFTVSVRNRGCDIGSYEVELEDPAPPERPRGLGTETSQHHEPPQEVDRHRAYVREQRLPHHLQHEGSAGLFP